jgi:hypothetical protein
MQKQIKIIRDIRDEAKTMGRIYVGGDFIGYTLELPWKDNQPRISCIPTGTYEVVFRDDPGSAYKYKHLHVKNVPGRSWILFHVGNFLKDTKGCILPGLSRSGQTVSSSRKAFNNLMDKLEGATSIKLVIENEAS